MFEFMRLPSEPAPVTVDQVLTAMRGRLADGSLLRITPLGVHRCRATGLPVETARLHTDQVDEMLFALLDGQLTCTLRSHSQLGDTVLDRFEEGERGFDCWVARTAAKILSVC
jgi:hypothetical protein